MIVLYGGTRPNGNTESLTEQTLSGLEVERINLSQFSIAPIKDQRHERGGFDPIDDDYDTIIDRLLPHDIIVFATPIYWYSMSGIMKNFIDRWSQTMRDNRYPGFRERLGEKTAYVIAVGGDNPHIKGLPMIQQFQYICDFMGITFAGYLLGQGSKPGDIRQDARAQAGAVQLNALWKEQLQGARVK
ncbi:flavodoxin family protein [Mechercharimyces sp. CAU 1602]|uniref:flavodoxin family protein n=1 Tax=Mechercharimyces sp. CAU 1602 TaxID=2973933 RepID=UPI0021636860|nr:flavodoxin family protein [Mechercharimyces sp. CAU 1602]MCS1352711.1 flavodoxin family protein [Mechercharimyces sp. CAU 1602]